MITPPLADDFQYQPRPYRQAGKTRPAPFFGTPLYVSLNRPSRESPDRPPVRHLLAWGLAFELFTGALPFQGETEQVLVEQHVLVLTECSRHQPPTFRSRSAGHPPGAGPAARRSGSVGRFVSALRCWRRLGAGGRASVEHPGAGSAPGRCLSLDWRRRWPQSWGERAWHRLRHPIAVSVHFRGGPLHARNRAADLG